MRESFVFYKSFYLAIQELDEKKQLKLYRAIMKLALENEEIENLSGIEKAIFELIKPQILANNKRYEDGKKGGRPPKKETLGFDKKITTGFENNKKNKNQNETKTKPNVNVNVNDNENDNVNDNENENDIKNTPHPFGNFQNVYLTEKQKNEFECLVMDKKTAEHIINNLSENIACKKEQIYDEQYPEMHLLRLKRYWQNYRTRPKGNGNNLSFAEIENLLNENAKKIEQKKVLNNE